MDFYSKSPKKKIMYVKQQLMDNIKNGKSKVLINPNFVPTVHVNPHFNKSFLQSQRIHVNPNLLRQSATSKPPPVPNKTIVTTPTKLIKVPQNVSTNKLVMSTRTKLVRLPQTRGTITNATSYNNVNESPKKNNEKPCYKNNQFKIDHRPSSKTKLKRSSYVAKTLNASLSTSLKHKSKLYKKQYVNISGTVYRRSSKSLVVINKRTAINSKKFGKGKLLTIRGQKYKLDSNHRTLTLITNEGKISKPAFKTIYLGGIPFKEKQPNVFVKLNQKHTLLSQVKQKSIHTLRNKLKKANIPCPFYRRFGKCKGKENGTCIRIHNPDQIALCPKLLQGVCLINNCPLSHQISAEKMPTCKFFLDGLCSKDNCPYLHVKINARAEICMDFLEGFCRKGAECEKRHQYLCPQFEKDGSCKKLKCPYPHGGNKVRKTMLTKKLQKNPVNYKNLDEYDNMNGNIENTATTNRYYDESKPNSTSLIQNGSDEIDLHSEDDEQNKLNATKLFVRNRPKLGNLPSFIPFLDEKES